MISDNSFSVLKRQFLKTCVWMNVKHATVLHLNHTIWDHSFSVLKHPFLKSGVSINVKHPFSCYVKHPFLKSGVSIDVKNPLLKSGVSLHVKHPFLKSGNSKVTKSGECASHCFKCVFLFFKWVFIEFNSPVYKFSETPVFKNAWYTRFRFHVKVNNVMHLKNPFWLTRNTWFRYHWIKFEIG